MTTKKCLGFGADRHIGKRFHETSIPELVLNLGELVATAKTLHQLYTICTNCREIECDKCQMNNDKHVPASGLEQLREQLQKLLDDFGSVDEYDNDDVIELHKGLKVLAGAEKGEEAMSECRTLTCKLPIRCVDCGENVWCYGDQELEELKKAQK